MAKKMNEQESVDAESAYGSEISSNSNFLIKKDTFTIEGRTSRNQIRWKWLKDKLRGYMVLEAVFFMTLVFLVITCYRITSQNQETQRMILSIQSQLNSIQKPIEKDIVDMKEEEAGKVDENKPEKAKITLKEVLMGVRIKPVMQQSQSIINSTMNSEKTHVPPVIPTASTYSFDKKFNAASLLAFSSIDSSLSSSSNLNPSIGYDQSSLVLVDRPEPPANKAWCTSDKNPVLTVSLGYYIGPTVVSYQHSKWDGSIPDDAPKEYSVEACLDNRCRTRKSLFPNCEYNSYGLQEQICNNNPYDSIDSPVGKLQFRFHKNHGNTERTCVSLVRVYSKSEVVKERKIRRLEDTTTCLDLSHHYHNNPKIYKYYTFHNCTVLYSKGCCQECPECCEECEIDYVLNPNLTLFLTCFGAAVTCSIVPFVFMNFLCELKRRRQQGLA